MTEAKNYNEYLISIIESTIQKTGKKKLKILDFGAGSGTYADMLKERGITVDCLEPDAVLQKTLKKKGYSVVGDISKLSDGSYDIVYALNVFEHIEKDVDAAQKLATVLKKDGRLIIYVPAFQSLYTAMDERVGHHRRYKKARLDVMADAAGLKVETLKYCDPIGYSAALAYRFIGNKDGVLSPKSVKYYDRVVFPVSKVIEPATKGFIGKNVLLVAKR